MQQPEKVDVVKLFRNDRRYVVPMFQRKYVWDLKDQWEPLWKDVRTCAEAIERKGNAIGVQHFLGAIVLQEVDAQGILRLPAYTIIDGQQRLTTLQVMLAAMRRVASEPPSPFATLLRKLTTNDAEVDVEVERYKVWPSTFDRDAFTTVIDAEPHELTSDAGDAEARWRTRPRLIEASAYFETAIRDWLAQAPGGLEARLTALHLTLSQALQVVSITLDADEDAQVIFETMNARGVPLRPSDLIRNFLFHQAVRRGEDPNDLYDKYWRDFDQEGIGELGFWSQEEAIGRERQQRLVAFLLHFLEHQLARELSVNTMFDAFREWWDANEKTLGSVEAVLAMLKAHGAVYKGILRPDPETPVGAFIARLNTLQYRTAYPLLLHLLTRFEPTDPRLTQIARDFDSWMIRRYVCRLQTRNYGQTFITLLRDLKGREADAVPLAVRDYFSRHRDDARRWPSDEEFHRAWTSQRAYKRLQVRGIRMILKTLEASLATDLQETVTYHPNISVEHVLPVQWRKNWPEPDPALATLDESAEEVRDRLLHTFGNLTLLTQKLNSKNSNAPFKTKKRLITKNSVLRLNVHFHDADTWDEHAILKRAEELFKTATGIWPHRPTTPAADTQAVTGPRLSLQERHLSLRAKLKALLPDDFTTRESDKYTQYRRETWPTALHYELGAGTYKGRLNISLHSEFTRNDPRRPAGHRLLDVLAHRIKDVFEDSDAELNDYARANRRIDLIYDLETDDDTILSDFAKLVDHTFEFVDEHVQNGPLAPRAEAPKKKRRAKLTEREFLELFHAHERNDNGSVTCLKRIYELVSNDPSLKIRYNRGSIAIVYPAPERKDGEAPLLTIGPSGVTKFHTDSCRKHITRRFGPETAARTHTRYEAALLDLLGPEVIQNEMNVGGGDPHLSAVHARIDALLDALTTVARGLDAATRAPVEQA